MSRGLGRVQQAVVWALQDEEPQTLRQLASNAYQQETPTRAAYVAVTRAVRGLTRRGWTSVDGRWRCRVALTPSARLAVWMATNNAGGARQAVEATEAIEATEVGHGHVANRLSVVGRSRRVVATGFRLLGCRATRQLLAGRVQTCIERG